MNDDDEMVKVVVRLMRNGAMVTTIERHDSVIDESYATLLVGLLTRCISALLVDQKNINDKP